MFEIIMIIVFVLSTAFFAFLCWRLWQRVELQDRAFTSIHGYLNLLHQMCAVVLTREIYADEPIVRAFVDVCKDVEPFLLQIDGQFYYDEEVPDSSKTLEGYYQDKAEWEKTNA